MPVVSVAKKWSGPGAKYSSDDGQKFSQNIGEVYSVLVSDPVNDNELTALSATGVPVYGQSYFADYWLRAREFAVAKIGPILYEVAVGYKSKTPTGKGPFDEPPKVKWSTVKSDEEVDRDMDGKLLVNACGEALTGIKFKVSDLCLTYQVNLPNWNVDLMRTYTTYPVVNSDVVLGQPAGTALLEDMSADTQVSNDITYYAATFAIHFRRGAPFTTDDKAWYRRVANMGFYCYDSTNTSTRKRIRCVDDNGHDVTKVVPLKTNGLQEKDPTQVNFLLFKMAEPKPFSTLGIFQQ